MSIITVIFGGSEEFYIELISSLFKNKYNVQITKIAPFNYIVTLNKYSIHIKFCKNPLNDHIYKEYNAYMINTFGTHLPPSADSLIQNCLRSKTIIFCGLCGSLYGSVGDIHTPTTFKNLYYSETFIKQNDIDDVFPHDTIKIKNILQNKISGHSSTAITTNITLSPDFIENGQDSLINLAKKLSRYGDIVDKESYEIAKLHKSIENLGIVLLASDVISNISLMLRNKHHFIFDTKLFTKMVSSSLDVAMQLG